jgi:hypothetical protein
VAGKALTRKLLKAVQAFEDAEDPIVALRAARRVREAAESMERSKVAEARKAGARWDEIGTIYGMTKQGRPGR